MSPGGSQASAGEGLSPCNIGIVIGKIESNDEVSFSSGFPVQPFPGGGHLVQLAVLCSQPSSVVNLHATVNMLLW